MEECIFCKIIVGDVPSERVYQDDDIVAFLDISPVTKGHVLVVPRQHYKDVYDIPEELLGKMVAVLKKIASSVVEAAGADGFNIGMNNGEASGQVIFHAHMHLIPRSNYDGLKNWEGTGYDEGEMEKIGNKIRTAIKKVTG